MEPALLGELVQVRTVLSTVGAGPQFAESGHVGDEERKGSFFLILGKDGN